MQKLLIAITLLLTFFAGTSFSVDTKLSDLTELTTPTSNDLLYIVDTGATPGSKRITVGNFFSWFVGEDWNPTGTWDWSGATVSGIGVDTSSNNTWTGTNTFQSTVAFQQSDGTPIMTMPSAAPAVSSFPIVDSSGNTTWSLVATFAGITPPITSGQLACWHTDETSLVSCGEPMDYTEPTSNIPICRTGAGTTGGCTNITDIAAIAGTLGTTADYIPKASGTGGKTAQASGIYENGTKVDAGALNFVTTGTIQGGVKISSDADGMSAADMTTAGMYGTMFIATGAGTWILPRAVLGMSACLMDSGTSHDLILDVTAGSTIRLKGTEQADGIGITNAAQSTTGDFVCVIAVATDKWSTAGMSGLWVSQ